jgi:carboxymethylenebutenolidase
MCAVTGYCMGGALTLGYAAQFSDVDAVAPFYGIPSDALDLGEIKCPVQGHFAEIDDWCGPSAVETKLTKKLKVENTIYIYKGAHHAFTNEARPEVFDAKATEISLDRTMVFFGSKLF